MTFDKNNNFVGGLTASALGQRATQTRIRSLHSPEFDKLREELKALKPNEKKIEEDIRLIKEILDRRDQMNRSQP